MAHLMTGDIPPDVNDATADKLMQLFIMLKDSVKASLPSLGNKIIKCNAFFASFYCFLLDNRPLLIGPQLFCKSFAFLFKKA